MLIHINTGATYFWRETCRISVQVLMMVRNYQNLTPNSPKKFTMINEGLRWDNNFELSQIANMMKHHCLRIFLILRQLLKFVQKKLISKSIGKNGFT